MPPCEQPRPSEGPPARPEACKRGPGASIDALHLFRSCVARAPAAVAVAGSNVPDLPTAAELALRYRATVRELGLCLALLQVPGGGQQEEAAAALAKMEALIDRHMLTLTALALAGRQDVIRQFAATDCESQEAAGDGSAMPPARCMMLAAAAVHELQLTTQQDAAIARSMHALLDAERGRSNTISVSAPLSGAEVAQMRAFMAEHHMLSGVDVIGCLTRPQVALLMMHSWPLPMSMDAIKRVLVMRWTQQLLQRQRQRQRQQQQRSTVR